MTDKLKCCFCGSELAPHIDEWKSIRKLFICNNTGCFCWGQPMLLEIWQALIVGKKAQRQLRTVKDRCAKKIKAKEREIANYLNGISVRDKEIQDLCEQLQKTQEALEVATDALSNIDAFNCHGKGAMEVIAGMTSITNRALYKITSIISREE